MFYVVYCQQFLRTSHSSLHEAFYCIVIYIVTQQTLWHQVVLFHKMWLIEKRRCPRIEPWRTPQIQTGFASSYQNLLHFLGLVGLSKGTVVFHFLFWTFWGHDLMCGLHFLMQIRFYFDFWTIFSSVDEMQNLIKLAADFFSLVTTIYDYLPVV